MKLCPEHGRLCAYTGTEPDRCPWCHCLWSHILATLDTDPHSCEQGTVWSGNVRARRVMQAIRMRREAAIQRDTSTHSPPPVLTPTPTPEGP